MKVEEYTFGNTKIEIYDDFFRTEEEIEEILTRIGKIISMHLQTCYPN